MISFIDFFTDLTNPTLAFLPKALLVAVLSSLVCAVVGTHVVLRGMAFIGDAVAHAVFPGLAVAFAFQFSLLLGGAIAGITVAVLVTVFSQKRILKEDSLIGIFFAGAFAFGLVVIARVPGYTGSLQSFLFGSLTGISRNDVIVSAISSVLVIALTTVCHRALVTVSIDRDYALSQKMPVFALDMALYVVVTLAVVLSVRTIGNILVLALLITPAATARLLTNRIGVMMAIAPAIGAVSAVVGIYFSWSLDVPAGAAIVLVCTSVFILVWAGVYLRDRIRPRRVPNEAKEVL